MKTIRVGPFGEEGGYRSWDDGVHTGVRRIIIRSGIVVDAIQVEYEDHGCFTLFERHGNDGGSAYPINLDYPEEYLTSISGYYGQYSNHDYISSMTIRSNKRRFGTFGTKAGKYFSIPSIDGKIVGFFGRYGSYLTSLGAYLEPSHPHRSIGPFGGNGGVSWDDGVHTAIRRITIVFESIINSILIDYDNDGSLVSSDRHGGNGGGNKKLVELDYPNEYVTSISGYYSVNRIPILVQSLTIQTNKRVYGPFGEEKGKYFSFPPSEGKIIGFHGRCSAEHLDSIGGHLEITPNLCAVKTIGPFGEGSGNSCWDDEIHLGIKQIRITHGLFVHSISTEYYSSDGSVLVKFANHPEDDELNNDTIKLDFPDEFLTSVSGYYDLIEMNNYEITSLTFQSNRRVYGPFGRVYGKYFSFPSFDGKILGFHGRCTEDCLYGIGAHIESISNPKPSEFIEPFGRQVGDKWDDGVYTTIRQLVVTCGSVVNSICIEYDKKGHSVWSTKHGESVGEKAYTIKLDYPDEFLISLSGSYSENSNCDAIQSLKIQSNKKRYGPFGTEGGNKEFSLSSTYGKIIGFHGTSGDYLYSIGAYLKPIPMSYQYETFGPYGLQEGRILNRWDDGIYTTIRQLIIGAGPWVNSIHIEYDHHGRSVWSSRHGESTGGKKHMVKLEYPSEYLVSMSGYYGSYEQSSFIYSLTIQSNRRTYGPFGSTRGAGVFFSTPPPCGKIIGSHGTTNVYGYLRSIGVYINKPTVLGPFGGQGGGEWNDGIYKTLRQIQLTVREFGIESICFEYDKNGRFEWSTKHGSKAQGKLEEVVMESPSEFLISVSGTYGKECGLELVQSIKFQSNRKTYGPFGLDKGTPFSLAAAGDSIIGFHGRSGFFLDSIGVYSV